MASEETENFQRLASLLIDLGTEVLRQLFLKYALTPQCKTVSQFLCNEHTAINRLHPRIIRAEQLQLLCPGPGKVVDPEEWDVSLLTILLLNLLPSITSAEKNEIKSLRSNRNVIYGHKSSATLSHLEFNKYWTIIEASIMTLATACNDQAFILKIQTLIARIKVGPLDIKSSVDVLIDWYEHDATTSTRIAELDTKLGQAGDELKDVKKTLPDSPKDSVFDNLKRHTHILLEEKCKHPFVQTEQYDAAKAVLSTNNVVTISGKPGEGKTITGLQLMKDICSTKDNTTCVLLYNASQWDHVDIGEVGVIMLDDVFGKYSMDVEHTEQWRPVLLAMQPYVTSGQLKLIITTRINVLNEAAVLLRESELVKCVIQLSSDKLSQHEKERILDELIIYFDRDKSEIDVRKCCTNYKAPIGFPYSCFLFSANKDLFKLKDRFFRRPVQFFKESIEGLERKSRAALLFLFYKQGQCFENDLKRNKGACPNTELKEYVSSIEGMNEGELSLTGIRQTLTMMTDVYISHIDNVFSFSHNTIYECVALMHSTLYPEEVIASCTWDFLQGCVTTDEKEDGVLMVVCKENYTCLSKRFITELLETNHFSRLSSFREHPVIDNNQFCVCFLDVLRTDNKLKDLFTVEMKDGLPGFLSKFLRNRKGSMHFAESAISYLKCQAISCTTTDCWKCTTKNDAIRGACFGGNRDIASLLINEGAKLTRRAIVDVCEGGNEDLVKYIISILKKEGIFDGTEVYASKALFHAAKKFGSMFNTLKDEGVVAMPLCIYDCCQHFNFHLVQTFTRELKTNGRWDPLEFWIINGMNESLSKKNLDIYEYLKTEGVRPNRGSLPYAVKTSDLSLVKKVVADMKAYGSWTTTDSKLSVEKLISNMLKGIPLQKSVPHITDKGLAESLIVAKGIENKGIYQYLVTEGIEFNMQTLKWAVKQAGIGLVEDVVDELKNTGKFNTKCKEAGEALIAAKVGDKQDIYDFLVAEGIRFVLENLAEGVISHDIVFVKTIVQSLQADGNWVPSHPSIQTAFIEAYSFDDKNIFKYLQECGVQINAVSVLTAVFAGEASTVEMCIEVMKSTNTWNPADPMLNMCLQLSKTTYRDIHDALIRAGVGTSSATFLQAAMSNDCRHVFLILDELVKTGRWDPKGDPNIVNAFRLYCERFNALMYVAMVKKGCVVNMDCLHMILARSKSLMYGSGPVYKKEITGTPSLVALSASKIARYCIMDVAKHGYQPSLFACIHAYEETSTDMRNSVEFNAALESACTRCDGMVFNMLADSGVVVTKKCINNIVDSVLARARSNTRNACTGPVEKAEQNGKTNKDVVESTVTQEEKQSDSNMSLSEKVKVIADFKPNSLILKSLSVVTNYIQG